MVNLADIIARVESSNNPAALRFELLTFQGKMIQNAESIRILRTIATVNSCSQDTARMIYSTSWGFFQIMGFNLYGDLKYEFPIAAYFGDEDSQYKLFGQWVQMKGINYSVQDLAASRMTREKFGTAYNGDGKDYADSIESALKYFSIEVQ